MSSEPHRRREARRERRGAELIFVVERSASRAVATQPCFSVTLILQRSGVCLVQSGSFVSRESLFALAPEAQ